MRTVLDIVVNKVFRAVSEEDHGTVRILVPISGCDVGLTATEAYVRAAEARGTWDARLEPVAADAMLYDISEDAATRVGTAGWNGTRPVAVAAAKVILDALGVSRLCHECRNPASDCLVSVRGDSVLIASGDSRAAHVGTSKHPGREAIPERLMNQAVMQVAGDLSGSVVVGPVAPEISYMGRSPRSALAGLRALPSWAEAPNLVYADDLLPERLLTGDELTREQILDLVHAPLHEVSDPFESTVATHLALGGNPGATAQNLLVHANAVRYRLGRVSGQVDWDVTNARDGLMPRIAIIAGRLAVSRGV